MFDELSNSSLLFASKAERDHATAVVADNVGDCLAKLGVEEHNKVVAND